MSHLFRKYWYLDEPSVRAAGFYNLRDSDLSTGGHIQRGEIIAGQCGYCVAEAAVAGFSGRACEFLPNRCVAWHGHYLTCMALDSLPAGPALRGKTSQLRHKHYVVAELPSAELIAQARKIGLEVVRSSDGRALANLEIFTVPNRTPEYRRAKLL